jgi:sugar-specific transcriptional regulator TrmB
VKKVEESVHSLLREMGLSPYEIDALMALLSIGSSSAVDLLPLCKVPRSRIYQVLTDLVSKGFASMRPGKPTVYEAVPPRDAFGYRLYMLRTDVDRRIKSMESKVESVIPLLEKISRLKPNRAIAPEDVAWVYYNEERFQNNITGLVLNCINSFRSFTSLASSMGRQDAYRSRVGAINAALEKGVDVRLIQALDNSMDLGLYLDFIRKGAKHMVPTVDLKESFWITDANTAALLVKDENGRFRYGLVVQDQFISSLLNRYFDDHWEKSVPAEKVIQQLQREQPKRKNPSS